MIRQEFLGYVMKYYVLMNKNEKIRHVQTIPEMGRRG
jgi:hypothetical protein